MAFTRGKDILAPYYRDLGLAVGIGLTPYEILLSLFARAPITTAGVSSQPLFVQSRRPDVVLLDLAAGIPHAVGAAFALSTVTKRDAPCSQPAATERPAKASGTSP